MFASIIALILSLLFPTTDLPTPAPVQPAYVQALGADYQYDPERADALAEEWVLEGYAFDYRQTRLDGVQPVLNADMYALQDREYPNMWHIYKLVPTVNL